MLQLQLPTAALMCLLDRLNLNGTISTAPIHGGGAYIYIYSSFAVACSYKGHRARADPPRSTD